MSYRIAIVGAGMAGLACAQACVAAGMDVQVFDKGRRPGGRIATRRAAGVAFDHGAQFVTARTAEFASWLEQQAARGIVAPWPAGGGNTPRWVGTPGMSTLAQAMTDAAGGITTERHVSFLHREAAGWMVRHHAAAALQPGAVTAEGGALAGPFDRVVLAMPAHQAEALLRGIGHAFAEALAPVVVAPCWTLLLAFAEKQPGPDCLAPADGPLAWVARNASRPGRPAVPDAWVANASPAWSRAALERDADSVLSDLRAAFAALTGIAAEPAYAAAHRWRYAQTETPLGTPCLWDAVAGLAVCGDWCLGARVEAAFGSGRAAAAALA